LDQSVDDGAGVFACLLVVFRQCHIEGRFTHRTEDRQHRRFDRLGRTLRIGSADVGAQITRDSTAFVRWITRRGSWEVLGVDAHGDPSALDVVRRLTVF
jgi:hypothetical protein